LEGEGEGWMRWDWVDLMWWRRFIDSGCRNRAGILEFGSALLN
jgi:hypothetical protein